jgi:Integrase core domain
LRHWISGKGARNVFATSWRDSADGILGARVAEIPRVVTRAAERLIGSLRREFLDHVLIVSERHLRRVLALYSSYYNESRMHLALEKDAPLQKLSRGAE